MQKDLEVRMINNEEEMVTKKYIRNQVTAFPINGVYVFDPFPFFFFGFNFEIYIWLKNKNIKYQIIDNKSERYG